MPVRLGLADPTGAPWGTDRFDRMVSGTARRRVAFRLARHSPLPAPKAQRRSKILHPEGLGHRHRLPGRIIMELGQPDNQALRRGHPSPRGRVAIGDVLEKCLWVDRLATLPIEHGEDTADPRVEIKRASVAADLTIDGALDSQWFESHALRPIFPTLHGPGRGIGQA